MDVSFGSILRRENERTRSIFFVFFFFKRERELIWLLISWFGEKSEDEWISSLEEKSNNSLGVMCQRLIIAHSRNTKVNVMGSTLIISNHCKRRPTTVRRKLLDQHRSTSPPPMNHRRPHSHSVGVICAAKNSAIALCYVCTWVQFIRPNKRRRNRV